MATSCPRSEYRAIVPPQPDSGSSGCAPATITLSLRDALETSLLASSGNRGNPIPADATVSVDFRNRALRVRFHAMSSPRMPAPVRSSEHFCRSQGIDEAGLDLHERQTFGANHAHRKFFTSIILDSANSP